jgi:hypothetical protein
MPVSFSPIWPSETLEFVVRCLDHSDPSALILFSAIPADRLTPGDFATLQAHEHFSWCFIGASLEITVVDFIAESTQQ